MKRGFGKTRAGSCMKADGERRKVPSNGSAKRLGRDKKNGKKVGCTKRRGKGRR